MINSLLIGEEAIPNLTRLKTVFNKTLVERATNFYDCQSLTFHPLLNCKKALSGLSLESYKKLSNISYKHSPMKVYLSNARTTFENPNIRNCFDLMPAQYSIVSDEVCQKHWSEFETGLSILKIASPWMGQLFDTLIYDVWFISKDGIHQFYGGAASTYESLGLIFMSFRPPSSFQSIEMAIALAHELGHNCFFLLQSGQKPISNETWSKKIYSGVRGVDRPAIASFHAAVALGYMLSFCSQLQSRVDLCRELNCSEYLDKKVKSYKNGLSKGLDALKEVQLSELGQVVALELIRLKNST